MGRSLLAATRTTIAPATTTTSGNASQLIQTAVKGFLGTLNQSAPSALMSRGLSFDLESDMVASLPIPIRSTAPITPGWVNELSPIPIQSDVLAAVALGPARKLGTITVATRTLLKRSDGQSIFTTLLQETASKGLDAAVFSSETGSGDAHEGLLNNATSVSGSGDLLRDLQALAASVSAAGSGQVVFVGGTAFAAAANFFVAKIKATILG